MRLTYALSAYFIRTFLKWFAVVSVAIGGLFALLDLMELFRRTGGKAEVGITLVLKMFLYRFPSYFQDMLPFVVFFAAILSFWNLNRHQELLICKASGVSIWQILSPLVGISLLIGLFDLLVVNSYSAKMLEKFQQLESVYIYGNRTPISISTTGFWLREKNHAQQTIIHAKQFDEKKAALHQATLYIFDEQDRFVERIDAQWIGLSAHQMILHQGWRLTKDGFPEIYQQITRPTTLSVNTIRESFSDPKTLNFYTLRSYANLLEQSGLSATAYVMQWHTLLARCCWLGIMILLAATFSLAPIRSGGTMKLIVGGIAITFMLYFLRDMTYALGGSGNLPPFLAAWVPAMVTGFFAATKLLYSEDG